MFRTIVFVFFVLFSLRCCCSTFRIDIFYSNVINVSNSNKICKLFFWQNTIELCKQQLELSIQVSDSVCVREICRKSAKQIRKSKRILLRIFSCCFLGELTLSFELSWHRMFGMRCGLMPKAQLFSDCCSFLFQISTSNQMFGNSFVNKTEAPIYRYVFSLCNLVSSVSKYSNLYCTTIWIDQEYFFRNTNDMAFTTYTIIVISDVSHV